MKRTVLILTALLLALSLGACGRQQETAPATTELRQEDGAGSTFTGVLVEKKDFMITVTGDDGSTYGFNLEGTACPMDPGSRITVTYKGDIRDFDAQLTAVRIRPAEGN